MRRASARMVIAMLTSLLAIVSTLGAVATPASAAVTISGPITGGNGSPAAVTTAFDLGTVGYQQAEFFLSGTANAYTPTAPLAGDGRWSVAPSSQAPFTTRVIVNRPSDPRRFNGTVFVEWLNVSIGTDVGVDWGFGHNELIRRGYAWVGVSAQAVGLNAAKAADPVRYAPLSHPGDSYSYDMFTQAGQALRADAGTLLGGLKPQRLIASGESQSAGRMVTYIDAVHPLVHTYDGFLVHSRGSGGAPVSQSPLPSVSMPSTAMIRTDNPTPVLVLQSETDVNPGARQDDSPTYRLWEMAGTSHVDAYSVVFGLGDVGDGQGEIAMFDAMQQPTRAWLWRPDQHRSQPLARADRDATAEQVGQAGNRTADRTPARGDVVRPDDLRPRCERQRARRDSDPARRCTDRGDHQCRPERSRAVVPVGRRDVPARCRAPRDLVPEPRQLRDPVAQGDEPRGGRRVPPGRRRPAAERRRGTVDHPRLSPPGVLDAPVNGRVIPTRPS